MESNFLSIHPSVEFCDIMDQYCGLSDLHCTMKINDYIPQEGDRVALFKLGWVVAKDYIAFEWVTSFRKNQRSSVTFSRHVLPKRSVQLYQFCYLNGENELHGASTPFQFCDNENSFESNTSLNEIDVINSRIISAKDNEIKKLKEENAILRKTLIDALIPKSDAVFKNYDKEIEEVKGLVKGLRSLLSVHQNEINMLKIKIHEGGEEYRKLYLEKAKVERKFEKLKTKRDRKVSIVEMKPLNDCNFDIGDLNSLPPFPSHLIIK